MIKKRLNKWRLLRPSEGFLPIALLMACYFGGAEMSAGLFFAMLAARLLSLASATGLRAAFAEQPALRGVRRTVWAALPLQLCGGGLAALACLLCPGGLLPEWAPWLVLAGTGLNIEHVFYEYLFAAGDGLSGSMCRGITAVLTAAGAVMAGGPPAAPGWLVAAALLSAGIAALIAVTLGGLAKGGAPELKAAGAEWFSRLSRAGLLRRAPINLLQAGLYAAVGGLLWRFRPFGGGFGPFFAGLAVFELCRSPFRRSPSEARGMNLALAIACAVGIALAALHWLPVGGLPEDVSLCGLMLVAGGLCGWALYGSAGRREE